jgi:hypothetical protein
VTTNPRKARHGWRCRRRCSSNHTAREPLFPPLTSSRAFEWCMVSPCERTLQSVSTLAMYHPFVRHRVAARLYCLDEWFVQALSTASAEWNSATSAAARHPRLLESRRHRSPTRAPNGGIAGLRNHLPAGALLTPFLRLCVCSVISVGFHPFSKFKNLNSTRRLAKLERGGARNYVGHYHI